MVCLKQQISLIFEIDHCARNVSQLAIDSFFTEFVNCVESY